MRSLVLDTGRSVLEARDTPPPELTKRTDVLFRVREVGVCGTDRDLASFRWHAPHPKKQFIIGHEALGQVVATGASVTCFSRGDWVVPLIRRSCQPPCPSCARGRTDLCLTYRYTERGIIGADGYFAEFAVDAEQDLIAIPEPLAGVAILLEPLSVVEKAIARAIAVRQTDGESALVLGLGPIGMLAALVLNRRGYRARVYSAEPSTHPRARLLAAQGIEYLTSLSGSADIIIEAAGSGELALAALPLLNSSGVFVLLGARRAEGSIRFIDMIVGNQTIVGSVNASRESFDTALADLKSLGPPALSGMIRRFGFDEYRQTLLGEPGAEPKYVHVISEG